jgi:hypothetical protein
MRDADFARLAAMRALVVVLLVRCLERPAAPPFNAMTGEVTLDLPYGTPGVPGAP